MRNTRRRSHYRRKPQNVVWQRAADAFTIDVPPGTPEGWLTGFYSNNITPGIGLHDDHIDEFDDQHVLERVRGHVLHNAHGESIDLSLPISFAMLKVPIEFTVNSNANTMDTQKGDDYFLFQNGLCGLGDARPTTNVDLIDNKAKRRFDPGDVIKILWSLFLPRAVAVNQDIKVEIGFNLSFLWKLRT